MAGGGDFYAGRVLDAVGVEKRCGVLRLSFTHYTSDAEIQQLLDALDATL
jgi:selenocysteine lyase/cysteine desulfurase